MCDKLKKGVIYIFDSHFVFRSLDGECRGHFGFLVKIYLSVMFIPDPLSYFKKVVLSAACS